MAGDADEQLDQLKARFGVEKDIDLARKLAVDKRTVSAWRARGKLPARYEQILEGGDNQSINTPPQRWAEHEQEAFNLAVFRFSRAVAADTITGSYRPVRQAFSAAYGFIWVFMVEAQREIVAELDKHATRSPRDALAMLIHDDLQAGPASIERDRNRLIKMGLGELK